ncbi:MAG: hypothetical protein ABSA43_01940 [Candidatus Microgenomates bacterium]|jgi:hypothetical protein
MKETLPPQPPVIEELDYGQGCLRHTGEMAWDILLPHKFGLKAIIPTVAGFSMVVAGRDPRVIAVGTFLSVYGIFGPAIWPILGNRRDELL